MSELTHRQRKELRELGWSVSREKARRPARIPRKHIPRIREQDIMHVEEALDDHLVSLESQQ